MGLSERRACSIVGADRKMVRYRSRRPPDTELRARLRELANERRRFGYRRLFILLRREGEPSGINRIHRLYREEGLTVRKRRARRKAVGTRAPILVEAKPNARWSLDFVHDQFANGRRFRVLNIVDDVTKECLGAIPDTSISGRRVARELTAIVAAARQAGLDRLRQRHRVHLQCHAGLVQGHQSSTGTSSRRASRSRTPSSRASTAGCATNFLNETLFFDLDDAQNQDRGMGRRLQRRTPALVAEIPHAGGLRRHIHRNGRSAAQPRPAPPIARCSTRATWRTKPRDSNRRWMKVQWQVSRSQTHQRL